jgi:hypothetical protein
MLCNINDVTPTTRVSATNTFTTLGFRNDSGTVLIRTSVFAIDTAPFRKKTQTANENQQNISKLMAICL